MTKISFNISLLVNSSFSFPYIIRLIDSEQNIIFYNWDKMQNMIPNKDNKKYPVF